MGKIKRIELLIAKVQSLWKGFFFSCDVIRQYLNEMFA